MISILVFALLQSTVFALCSPTLKGNLGFECAKSTVSEYNPKHFRDINATVKILTVALRKS